MDTQELLRVGPSDRSLTEELEFTHRAPAVLPGLVTREIYLPPKVIAPPLAMAGRVEKPSKAFLARIRLSKRAKIKPVNGHYRKLIHRAANRHGIEPAMIKAIIMAESSFNPKAVSSRGALGLMQLMPQTAESLGVADAFDPGNNIDAGARYLRQLLNHFRGDIELALAAYNAGIQNVLNHRGIPPYKATRSYVEKVLTYYEHYKRMVTS
jgi:soluble lytic murein transglycosylase-like protein